jgi:acetylornithine/N-succinyldiaminopimelate aminotransferase
MAAMKVLLEEEITKEVPQKEKLFKSLLVHQRIKVVHSFGLWMAVEFDSFENCKRVIDTCLENGLMTDWFLFAPNCLRISPPLIISDEQIKKACSIILQAVEDHP